MPSTASASASTSTSTSKRPLSLPASIWNRRRKTPIDGMPDPGHRPRTRSGLSALLSPRPDTADEQLDPLLTAQYPDPDAVKAFMEALEEDQGKQEPPSNIGPTAAAAAAWTKLGLPTLKSPVPHSPTEDDADAVADAPPSDQSLAENPTQTIPLNSSSRVKVGKIAAVSDFAPVRERVTSRRGGSTAAAGDTGRREGLIYAILRWPLLIALFLTIGLEFFAYVFTRQVVNAVEWLVAHRGKKGVLRRKLRNAQTFQEWRDVALELDDFMKHEKWKVEDASGLYDWILIKKVLHSLETFRQQGDAHELMAVLDLCCRNNFAGTENFRLYSETYYGTKYLIEAYLAQVELGLQFITKTDKIPAEQKRAFFKGVSKNLGRSGLCLSGGGAFGYYHIGLVRALLDADLLPKIVSGTSAGGLIAALTCTRTDEELSRLLVPELADRITACEEPLRIWAARAWKTGARFDPRQWAEKAAFFTRGSLTFKEAFDLTGKSLSISVIPSDKHSPTKLLNHLTAPRCVIWSALLASAAVPGLLPPVCLMQKTRKGEFVPWNWGHRFKDGSLRVDIPLQDLHSMFHVNYPIVSQVNPHVHLFFFAPKGMPGRPVAHRKGKGWRGGFILSASEHVLKLHLSLNFKIMRDLDLLPHTMGTDWSSVFLQKFDGAVTIWPKTRFWDWVRILSDPDRSELARMMRVSQAATFPKLHMIENRIRIERAVEAGRRATRLAIRKQQKAAGDVQTPGGGPVVDTPNQDSGTDGSTSRFRPMNSDTDGGETSRHQPATDYFRIKEPLRNRPRPQGTNTPHSLAAARRKFGNAMGMMAFDGSGRGAFDPLATPGGTDGTVSPASELGTPGELPRPSRARSAGMNDGGEEDEDTTIRYNGSRTPQQRASPRINGNGGDTDTHAPASREDDEIFREDFGLRARGERLDAQARREDENGGKALTAADLTPEVKRFGSRRNSRQHRQEGSGSGSGSGSARIKGEYRPHYSHHRQEWSANRGSIGPESPWDQEAEPSEGGSSSESESDQAGNE